MTSTEEDLDSSGLSRWRKRSDVPLIALAVGSLPLLALEIKRNDLPYGDRIFLDVINVVVLIAFAIDYSVEFALVESKRSYVRSEWASALIVISQGMALLPSLTAFGVLRVLRAGRALRFVAVVFRVAGIQTEARLRGRDLLRKRAAAFGLSIAGLTWITSAVAFTLVEEVGASKPTKSWFDALWWSLSTITTVGYGDVYPVTTAGRIVGGFTMIVGISTFAIVTAKVAEFLVRSNNQDSHS
jgi:voltage-gated potassium channel